MSEGLFIKALPFVVAAVGAFLLLTPRNPWPAPIKGSELPLRHLRFMGALFLLVAATFAVLIFTGRIPAAQ
jgi:hypothetical protein